MTYNIIIADDHKMFLDGMLSILSTNKNYHILMTANSGKNIVKYAGINPNQQIDLVITDISMPEMDGITLNSQLKKINPNIKVLVVSMHIDVAMIDSLIKSDVDGYVPKNAEKKELLTAIETILKGEKYFSEIIKEAYMKSVFNKEKETLETLTQREKDVLKLIALENTTQEIADQLFLSKHTIESYRKNLISKLNVRNIAGLTKYAIKLGLVT
ncbi:MAG TPA: response regulator transcription factor [Flavobacteriia bacterium]|nr:response regulator transcription factor [Flavobacteriia bacterium]